MDAITARLECLRLAYAQNKPIECVVDDAAKLWHFIENSPLAGEDALDRPAGFHVGAKEHVAA